MKILPLCPMPPKMYILQIADAVTKLYFFLWDKKDKKDRINMPWHEVALHFHKNNFRSCLRKLCNQGLLSYLESETGITIELVGWDALE